MLRPVWSEDLIRLGHLGDGGYVLNKRILDHTDVLISFGIDVDWTFEADFKKKAAEGNVKIEAYDYSVDFQYFLNTAKKYLFQALKLQNTYQNILNSMFFLKKGLQFRQFFKREGINFYKKGIDSSNSELFLDFKSVFKNIKTGLVSDKTFIKMDIEGYEYKVLFPMLEFAEYINGFIVEFHDLDKHAIEFDNLISLAKEKGFVITHIHPNNWGGVIDNTSLPRFLEITFSKSSFFTEHELSVVNNSNYPRTGLDYPCVQSIPELSMRFETSRIV